MTTAEFWHQQARPSCVRRTDGHVPSGQGPSGAQGGLCSCGWGNAASGGAQLSVSADTRPPEVAAEDKEVWPPASPQPSPGPGMSGRVAGAFQPGHTLPSAKTGRRRTPFIDTSRRELDSKPVQGGSLLALWTLGCGSGRRRGPSSSAGLGGSAQIWVQLFPRPSPTAPQPPEKVSRDCLAYLFTLTQNRCMPAGRSSSRGCSDLNYQHPCLLEPSPMVPLHTDDSGSDGCSPATKRSRAKRPIQGRRGLRGLAVDKRESPV